MEEDYSAKEFCPRCGSDVPIGSNVCPFCGNEMRAPSYQSYTPPPKPETIKPKLAGAMLVVAGIIGVIYAVYMFTTIGSLLDMVGELPEGVDEAMIEQILQVCLAVIVITSVISIGGGFMAIKRTRWGFALIGSIAAIISIGPVYACTIIGIVALILLVLSKDEFH